MLWIEQLKAGDSAAAQRLWESYFQRMVELARRKLEGTRTGAADEEDVALSAFKSFCLGAREGKFTQLEDPTNLWPLLVAITVNKSVDLIRYENRKKRGGAVDSEMTRQPIPLSAILSDEPTPAFAMEVSDQLECLMERLATTGDDDLGHIALLKMEGLSNADIAARLGCVQRTVERKLAVVQRLWTRDNVL